MTTVIQSIISELPSGTEVYVFGSILRGSSANDVDILVLYDPDSCPPQCAYGRIAPVIGCWENVFDRKIDLTLLTFDENCNSQFSVIARAVPLEVFLKANPTVERDFRNKAALRSTH